MIGLQLKSFFYRMGVGDRKLLKKFVVSSKHNIFFHKPASEVSKQIAIVKAGTVGFE